MRIKSARNNRDGTLDSGVVMKFWLSTMQQVHQCSVYNTKYIFIFVTVMCPSIIVIRFRFSIVVVHPLEALCQSVNASSVFHKNEIWKEMAIYINNILNTLTPVRQRQNLNYKLSFNAASRNFLFGSIKSKFPIFMLILMNDIFD